MGNHTTTVDGWHFARVSGAYIDITPPGCSTPVEVINCWDYANGTAEIPDTAPALRAAAREWLDELDKHDERAYINAAQDHDRISTISQARETTPTYPNPDRIAHAFAEAIEVDHLDDDTIDEVLRILNRAGY